MDFIDQMPAFISPSISSRPSSLGNKRGNHTVEEAPVIDPFSSAIDEVTDMSRCGFQIEIDGHRSLLQFEVHPGWSLSRQLTGGQTRRRASSFPR